MKVQRYVMVICAMFGTASASTADDQDVGDKQIPRIVLHDILTNRVCIFESKLYSIGARVQILGVENECVNSNAVTFGSDDWDVRWRPVEKGTH